MIMDYDPAIKKLSEEFVPHTKVYLIIVIFVDALREIILCFCSFTIYIISFQCLRQSLLSLKQVYPRRALRAEDWRSAQMLSLLAEPSKIMNVTQTETVPVVIFSRVTELKN